MSFKFNPFTGQFDYYEKGAAPIDNVTGSGVSGRVSLWSGLYTQNASVIDETHLNYLNDVTGDIQDQLNGKQSTLTNPVTGIGSDNKVSLWNGVNQIDASLIDETHLNYLNDVTSDIQAQFSGKEPTLSKGNLTESTSNVLTVSGGDGSVIGAGTSIQVKQSDAVTDGYLSAAHWNIFNNKQDALTNPITGVGNDNYVSLWSGLHTQDSSIISEAILNNLAGSTSNIQTQLNTKFSGAGTTNYIPKFSSSLALNNSVMAQSGTFIGIGTPAPLSKFHIKAANCRMFYESTPGTGAVFETWRPESNPNNQFSLGVDTHATYGSIFKIANSGGFGSGTVMWLDKYGSMTVLYDYYTSSDRRLKEEIQPIESSLSKILQLSPVSFKWIHKKEDKKSFGLIAQELQEVFPELVSDGRQDGMLSVKYSGLIPHLIKSIQELKQEVEDLRGQISSNI